MPSSLSKFSKDKIFSLQLFKITSENKYSSKFFSFKIDNNILISSFWFLLFNKRNLFNILQKPPRTNSWKFEFLSIPLISGENIFGKIISIINLLKSQSLYIFGYIFSNKFIIIPKKNFKLFSNFSKFRESKYKLLFLLDNSLKHV